MTAPLNLSPAARARIDQEIAQLDTVLDLIVTATSAATDPIERQQAACEAIGHAAAVMVAEHGQPPEVVLLTIAAAFARRQAGGTR